MKNTLSKPPYGQAQTRSARNGPHYYQIRPDHVKHVLGRLKSCGYISHDPKLAGIVTRILLSKDSADFQALVTAQGKDFEFWTMFACSPEQVERWKRGYSVSQQVHLACCKAVEEITGEPFPVEEVSAIAPHFPVIKTAVEHLIEASRSALIAGQTVDHSEDALHNGYAIGIPVKTNVKDLRLVEIDAPDSFREFEIKALYRGELLTIGLVITNSSKHSILLDPRPFIWHGSDVWIGRKLVRLIKFQGGSVKEQISRLLNDHLVPEQLAS